MNSVQKSPTFLKYYNITQTKKLCSLNATLEDNCRPSQGSQNDAAAQLFIGLKLILLYRSLQTMTLHSLPMFNIKYNFAKTDMRSSSRSSLEDQYQTYVVILS